jgi:hypothetical protein
LLKSAEKLFRGKIEGLNAVLGAALQRQRIDGMIPADWPMQWIGGRLVPQTSESGGKRRLPSNSKSPADKPVEGDRVRKLSAFIGEGHISAPRDTLTKLPSERFKINW